MQSSARAGARRRSLRAEVVDILRVRHEGATTNELAQALVERGDPRVDLNKRDHTSAIRTALMTARQRGDVAKDNDGRWRVHVPDMSSSAAYLSVSPTRVLAGAPVQLSFSGWRPGVAVEVHLGTPAGKVIATVEASSTGTASGMLTLSSRLKAGTYNIYAVGGRDQADAMFVVDPEILSTGWPRTSGRRSDTMAAQDCPHA